MKGFLILILSFVSLFSLGQQDPGKLNAKKLKVHEWIQGHWIERDTTLQDSSEIIHKMLIGTWVDTNYRPIGIIGRFYVELEIYKDSIIETTKYRPSELQIVADLFDSDYVVKHKNAKRDTTLHINREKYKYKILYVDETRNNSSFIGYSIRVPYPDSIDVNTANQDNFNEAMISSLSSKQFVVGGMWCPCVSRPTEVYEKKN